MVKLKSGIQVSQQLVDALLTGNDLVIDWETIDHIRHPGMSETQHSVIPRRVNGFELPAERIAHYLVTKYKDIEGADHEAFMVESSSRFVECGRTEYTANERKSMPADSKEAAQKMVIDELRDFIKTNHPN